MGVAVALLTSLRELDTPADPEALEESSMLAYFHFSEEHRRLIDASPLSLLFVQSQTLIRGINVRAEILNQWFQAPVVSRQIPFLR